MCFITEYTHIGVIVCNARVFKALLLSLAHDVLKHVRGSALVCVCVCQQCVHVLNE